MENLIKSIVKVVLFFNNKDTKGFKQLDKTQYSIGYKAIIHNTNSTFLLDDEAYVLPLAPFNSYHSIFIWYPPIN